MEQDLAQDGVQNRERLVKELKQTATKLLAEERKIYSFFELTWTVGRAQKRKYERNNSSNSSDSNDSIDVLKESSETKVDVNNSFESGNAQVEEAAEDVVAEYQEVKDRLADVENYQLLINLKLKLSKMIEPHWNPAWKTRMVEIIRGIRLEQVPTEMSTERVSSVVDSGYKVTIPLAPVIVGDQVVQGRECSVTFGTHRQHKTPRWSFPTLQPKDPSDGSIPKAENLDPLYVTKTVLGLVKAEMPTNLWYTILRVIEQEFQTTKFPLSTIVENQNIRDYRISFSRHTAAVEAKYGPENQVYVYPQHYNKKLYSCSGLLSNLRPGQWNTVNVSSVEFRIPIEPDRFLCSTSASALLAPYSKQAAKIAIDAQTDRLINLLFRNSTTTTGPTIGSVLDQSVKRAHAKKINQLLQIRKTSRKDAYLLKFLGSSSNDSTGVDLLWPLVNRVEISRHTLPENRYLIEWPTSEVDKTKYVTAHLFLDGKIPPIPLPAPFANCKSDDKIMASDHFSCEEFTRLIDFIVRINVDNANIFYDCFNGPSSGSNASSIFPSLTDDISNLGRPRGRLAATRVLMCIDNFEKMLHQLSAELELCKFPKSIIAIVDSYLQLEPPREFYTL